MKERRTGAATALARGPEPAGPRSAAGRGVRNFFFFLATALLIASLAGCEGARAFNRGERYADRSEWDLAVREYRKAASENPHSIEYRSALLRAEENAANSHYKRARSFLLEGKVEESIVELQQALYLNPGNAAVQSALKSALGVKRADEHYRSALTLDELGRLNDAISELSRAVELDPDNIKYTDSLKKLQARKVEAEPDESLTLTSEKPITLQFKNTDIKSVFDFLAKASGVNIIFDEDVKPKMVTVFAKDVSFPQALHLILSTHKLSMKKMNANTINIFPKSKEKMEDYEDLEVMTFYLRSAKARDIVTLLRSMLDTRKVHVNDVLNSVTVRDTPEKIRLAQKIIAANDLKESEVILDVEILEISRTKSLKYGWNFSPSLSVSGVIKSPNQTAGSNEMSLADLQSLSKDNIFLTLPGVVLNLIKQDSDAQVLANPRLRVMNNKQAKFHIGNRIPVQTSTMAATTANILTSSFEYKDVGIKVTVEPTVHVTNAITLKLNLEVSTLGDAVEFGNGQIQYRFGTRNADTVVNLRDGETVIIGGLIQDEERKGRVKIPLLSDIPILGKLFTSADDGSINTDILMSITPNIVRTLELPGKDVQRFWSGTEHTYDTKPLFITSLTDSPKPSAAAKLDKAKVLESMAKAETPAAPGPEALPSLPPSAPGPEAGQPAAPGTEALPSLPPAAPGPEALPPPAQPQVPETESTSVSLALKPAVMTASNGQEIRIVLNAAKVRDLYGAVITLAYNPAVVEFKTANEATLLKQDGQQLSFMFSNNVRSGAVDLYMTRIGKVGGVKGAGDLCTVVFQAKAAGSSDVAVKSVRMTNSAREELMVEVTGSKITVR